MKMTPEELKTKLIALQEQYSEDPETLHLKADMLLCECLTSLGYTDSVDIFMKMTRWYT